MTPIAREHDIITCPTGHPLYRITRDCYPHETILHTDMERLHPRAKEPETFARFEPCPMCKRDWFEMRPRRYHFEDGWRQAKYTVPHETLSA